MEQSVYSVRRVKHPLNTTGYVERTRYLRDIWGVTDSEDLDRKLMANAAHYFEAVEILLEPKLIKSKQ